MTEEQGSLKMLCITQCYFFSAREVLCFRETARACVPGNTQDSNGAAPSLPASAGSAAACLLRLAGGRCSSPADAWALEGCG
jgi:hypothetical protein